MTRSIATHRARHACLVVGALALLLSAGCGPGNGDGVDANGNLPAPPAAGNPPGGGNPGGGSGGSGNPNATFAWVQTNVFGGVCSQCHTGAGAPLGVNWSSQTNTCANVGRASAEISAMMEIESRNAAASYVIWKVQGAGPANQAIVGGRMPLGNPPLSDAAIQNMRDWINDGAPGC